MPRNKHVAKYACCDWSPFNMQLTGKNMSWLTLQSQRKWEATPLVDDVTSFGIFKIKINKGNKKKKYIRNILTKQYTERDQCAGLLSQSYRNTIYKSPIQVPFIHNPSICYPGYLCTWKPRCYCARCAIKQFEYLSSCIYISAIASHRYLLVSWVTLMLYPGAQSWHK